jgi:hypothetical protein
MAKCDVTILGAGPYGLAAGATLRAVSGLDASIWGTDVVLEKPDAFRNAFAF